MIKSINGEEFKESTKEGFSIVDVYGIHCGPCQVLAKTMEELDFDYPFLNILKVCSDDNREFCKEHKIMGVPTIFFVVDGKIKHKEVGALSADKIMEIAGQYMY